MLTVEVIPYSTFKQRIRLVKELLKTKALIEIYPNFIYVQKGENDDK